ncbi:programmed cell death protein 7 isoform X2 [Aplysia californica]|uniref:Programmed cell death protein 7 isoform X2 n=1 Tax=Aplysia californica TaxID=6500 RepID=A0ABM0JCT1_APLCA|nr:programmed cell death protein 7 isoform X2 [Aplysia californica]
MSHQHAASPQDGHHYSYAPYQEHGAVGNYHQYAPPNPRMTVPPPGHPSSGQIFSMPPPPLPGGHHPPPMNNSFNFSQPPPGPQAGVPFRPPFYNQPHSSNVVAPFNTQGMYPLNHPPPPPQPAMNQPPPGNPPDFVMPTNNLSVPPPTPFPSPLGGAPQMQSNLTRPPPPYSQAAANRNSSIQNSGTSLSFQAPRVPSNSSLSQGKSVSRPLSRKEVGARMLEEWVKQSSKSRKIQKKSVSLKGENSMKVWEHVQHLAELRRVLSSMSEHISGMEQVVCEADSRTWEEASGKIEAEKEKLKDLQLYLEKPLACDMMERLKGMRLKRARLREARRMKSEQLQRQREEWETKSTKIDQWQEKVMKQIKDKSMKEKRKAAADQTLSKVTKEIQDANRLVETMTALQKLRLIRRDAAVKRGDTDLGESRQSFEQKITDMTRLVKAQLEHYKEEESRLKSIIKSEAEESDRKREEIEKEVERLKQSAEDSELESLLFGPQALWRCPRALVSVSLVTLRKQTRCIHLFSFTNKLNIVYKHFCR